MGLELVLEIWLNNDMNNEVIEKTNLKEREYNIEIPEFVYLNFPERYVLMLPTIPDRYADLISNAEAEPNKDKLSLKMKNNGAWKTSRITNKKILNIAKFYLVSGFFDLVRSIGEEKIESMSRDTISELLIRGAQDGQVDNLRQEISTTLESDGKIEPNDYGAKMEVEGAYYKGRYIPFEDFKKTEGDVKSEFDFLEGLSGMEKGDYLYRAVDRREMGEILEKGYYLVRDNTNFESEIGPQVEDYSKDENYAGAIVRIKIKGSYFRSAGISVPRITSIIPHFAEVEIKHGDEWLRPDEYKNVKN